MKEDPRTLKQIFLAGYDPWAYGQDKEKEAMTPGLKERFTEKVDKGKGAWRWTAAVNTDGYPKMKDGGKLRLASHVSLELVGRKVPAGKVVMHRDNNPANIAPSNLEVGTQPENLKHMRDEGRDRPRGVSQEPDVKQASALSGFGQELLEIIAANGVQLPV